jgi:2'-5' RNA ligase
MRLFIAVELPETLRERLGEIQRGLDELRFGLRFVRPEGIHLTLKFLGEVEPRRLDRIAAELRAAAADAQPTTLAAGGAGFFPGLERCRVVWVGLSGDLAPLRELHRDLDIRLHRLGFPRERGAFTPHLTLARVRDGLSPEQRAALTDSLAGLQVPELERFQAREVRLFESFLERGGARYETRATGLLGVAERETR